jgi:aminoglycoside phosphotransferase (APT) family kinase protein
MEASVQSTAEQPIAGPLLEFLRDELGDCRYAEPPVALTPGNETLICAFRLEGPEPPLDRPLVVRLFPSGTDPARALGEAVIQNALADQGFPAARTFASCDRNEVLGGPFFVMERLPGETFLGSTLELDRTGAPRMLPWGVVRQGLQMLLDMPRRLAEVDVRMHALDASRAIAALEEAGLPWQTRTVEGQIRRMSALVDQSSLDGLRPGVEWLAAHLPAARDPVVVCHGDMQPLNLLVADHKVSGVVDWSNTLFAPPECEIGCTRAAFLTLPLPLPTPLRPAERGIATIIADRYTNVYERSRPLDADAVRYHEAFHNLWVLAVNAERASYGGVRRDAWGSPRARQKLVAHFHAISGEYLEAADPP